MKRNKFTILLVITLIITLLFAGCGDKNKEKDANSDDTKKEDTVNNPASDRANADALIIGITEAPEGTGLPIFYSTQYDKYVIDLMFEPMFDINEEGE